MPKRLAASPPWLMIAIFVVLSLVVAGAGIVFYRTHRSFLLDTSRRGVDGGNRTRTAEALAWRQERLRDGAALQANDALTLVSRQLARPTPPAGASEAWNDYLALLLTRRDYRGAALLGADGTVWHSTGSISPSLASAARRLDVSEAAAPLLSDPVPSEGAGDLVVLSVPLPRAGDASGGPLMIALDVDPSVELDPTVRGRALPTSSTQNALVRAEPGRLVYLGPGGTRAPFATGEAIPRGRAGTGGERVAAGREGLFTGTDFQGRPCVGAARRVGGTAWWIVTSVSEDAVLDSERTEAWRLGLLVFLVIATAGIGMLLGWNRRQAAFYRQLYEAEVSREALAESFDHLTRYANDVIVLADENGIIVEANERAQEAYGYSREEIIGLPVERLRAAEIREQTGGDLKQLMSEGNFSYTANHVRKNGETFPVEVRARYFVRGGRGFFHGIIRDVTERERMERQLRESAERYRLLFESANDPIVLADAETGRILDVNHKTASLLGYEVEELRGRHHSELHPPERRNEASRNLRGRVDGSKVDTQAVSLYTRDGREIPVEVSASTLQLHGRPAVLGIFRDLTERLAAEQALRDSEKRFRSIVESTPAGIHLYRLDPDGRLVFEGANPAADRALGVDHAALVGRSIEEAWPGLSGTEIPRRYEEVCRAGTPWAMDAMAYESGGVKGVFEVRAFQTAPGRAAVMFIDITEQQKTREAVRRSEETYRLAAEQTGQLLYDVDVPTGRTEWRGAITALTGYAPEEYASVDVERWATMVHPEDRVLAESQWHDAVRNGTEFRSEYRYQRKDGTYFLAEDHGVCVASPSGPVTRVLGTIRDVTAVRAAESQLRDSETRRQKLESLALLAGGIAHDFNNLLTGIIGNVSLAAHDAPAGSDLRNTLEEAESAGLRARGLTRQLLTFSKGGAPIKKVADVGRLLRETVTFACRGTAVGCDLRLPAEPLNAEIDEGQIAQVVNNIAINAVQAMPAGGTITVAAGIVSVPVENPFRLAAGPYVRVTLADTGIGIPQPLLGRVFDPYFTTKQQGSGLGLAISHSIVTKHGGALGVRSEVGAGTEFEMLLPAALQLELLPSDEPEPVLPAGGRALVMDDEEQVRTLAIRMLERLGFEAHGVRDGAEAIDAYRRANAEGRPFSFVIMDLTVTGGMGGKEAVREVLAIDPGAIVIVSSGYSSDPIMAAFKNYGFAAVLAKPYRLQQLKEIVARALA